jgi:rhamnosyltransferase
MMENSDLCGVVVTYHPPENVGENLRAIAAECGRVFVIDNGSGAMTQAALAAIPGVELVSLEKNLGLAAALNLGARRAAEAGCSWMVTFDQDSTPRTGMMAALRAAHLRNPAAAVIGPSIQDLVSGSKPYRWMRRHPRWPGLFQRIACAGGDLLEVTMVITSGSLVDLAVWQQLGGFDETLFIDYIDTDYCLRVIRAGRRVGVASEAVLDHRLGERRNVRLLGQEFRPTHHAAFRHYFIARNRVRILRRHALAVPHWALFDLSFACFNGFRVVAFEPEKSLKLKAVFLGTLDGLLGRFGECPPARRRSLDRDAT